MMIGRGYKDVYPDKSAHAPTETPVLAVKNLNWGTRLAGIDLLVGKGEIVGLGGLDGQGQRELLLALFGVLRGVDARIKIHGKPKRINSPRDAKTVGIALILEDRKTEGLVLPLSVRENISLASINRFARGGFISTRAETEAVEGAFRALSIHAMVAMAQTLPILTSGLDLSVGMIFVLTNCIASAILSGPPWMVVAGIIAVLLSGVVCGTINGALVVYGRLQPIIATLATGAVYHGLALIIRPVPGGSIEPTFAAALTTQIFGAVATTLVILLAVVLVVWVPFRLSTTGLGCYAIGSLELAAYMTGIAVRRSRLAAYMFAGLLAAIAGLLLTAMTLSGDASATSGGIYTLSSIAAVVIGGTSLMGGVGGAVGSIFGAFVLREVSDLLFVFDIQPLVQPFIQGLILLGAVSL
jgi:ribose transport system permease protein